MVRPPPAAPAHLVWTLLLLLPASAAGRLPLAISTWSGPFTVAVDAAYLALVSPSASSPPMSGRPRPVDAVQAGCAACQRDRCDGTVGSGGSPDERCETTLDALLMDGDTLDVGAVAGLRRVRDAVGVARLVLDHTAHSLLVGDLATRFAVEAGSFLEEDLSTDESRAACEAWRRHGCQPNYRVDVSPDPRTSCGPYSSPLAMFVDTNVASAAAASPSDHDTVAVVAVSAAGSVAAGTSTNGAAHRVPGRAGDAPIPGSGAYADSDVGGCGATGDGDLMMRLLPCYQAVESMRGGMSPLEAAEDAVARMVHKYPRIRAGLVVADRTGRHAGAAAGWSFTYSYRAEGMERAEVVAVKPVGGGGGSGGGGGGVGEL